MTDLKQNLELREIHSPESKIKVVVLLVVVAEEILPVLDKFKPERNEKVCMFLLSCHCYGHLCPLPFPPKNNCSSLRSRYY